MYNGAIDRIELELHKSYQNVVKDILDNSISYLNIENDPNTIAAIIDQNILTNIRDKMNTSYINLSQEDKNKYFNNALNIYNDITTQTCLYAVILNINDHTYIFDNVTFTDEDIINLQTLASTCILDNPFLQYYNERDLFDWYVKEVKKRFNLNLCYIEVTDVIRLNKSEQVAKINN